MVNRYAGEIHVNPMRILRNDDFNNDGQIRDIQKTLTQASELNDEISNRLQILMQWLRSENLFASVQFRFAEGGYISMNGLPDEKLKVLEEKGLIELFDFATDKEWVKKHGSKFGLAWENGKAVEL